MDVDDFSEHLHSLKEDEISLLTETSTSLAEKCHGFDEMLVNLQEALDRETRQTRYLSKDVTLLRKEVEDQKDKRKREREMLVTWLDRRVVQQKEAAQATYISKESKQMLEIEVSLLLRYREMIVKGTHLAGSEDPLMPKFL